MGTFIFNALKNLFKSIVIIVVSILTLGFMFVADILALVIYPIFAWRNPDKASAVSFLTDVLNWDILDDIINPRRKVVDNKLITFFQCLMRPMDAFVISLWNAWFLHYSPMKKRKFFIDMLCNHLQSLPDKVQMEYFKAVDFDRKVYLIQHNMLSPSVVELLSQKEFAEKQSNFCNKSENLKAFIYAGKVDDGDFENLTTDETKIFSEKFDLSLNKQYCLIRKAFKFLNYIDVLKAYIMRKGLHPSAVKLFYEKYDSRKNDKSIATIPVALECRQDLVTVQQTENACNQQGTAETFAEYLKLRGKLGFEAQVSMSAWQYEVFHKVGLKLTQNAVYEKLARVNKNNDSQNFVRLMMKYGEVDGDEIAMHQIAGDEKLSAMWLKHLSQTA